jgi:hypothetical protein
MRGGLYTAKCLTLPSRCGNRAGLERHCKACEPRGNLLVFAEAGEHVVAASQIANVAT